MNRILFPPILIALVLVAPRTLAQEATPGSEGPATRLYHDMRALETYRPGFAFWQHIFTIPDGSIAFGSASDGRLIAVFPEKGDWTREGTWSDPSLASVLDGEWLPRNLDDRRDRVAELLEPQVGPVLHNPTRGLFLLPNARRYGGFVDEWSAIYERFGVPPEIGLAQAIIESGLNGTRRSEARAIGFCQWLESNWRRLDRLSPNVIESRNQTTQAPYCAAYLTILATKYGSFIPALSDHHSGGANVGRTLINGERLGGESMRDRYFMGAQLAKDLRQINLYGYRDIYRTYGPRSYLYSEMVFGNMFNVRQIAASTPQVRIYAMRTPRTIRLTDITKRTRLSADEVRRFNPGLVRQVPAHATLYLPLYIKDFGTDVSFWHRPATAPYTVALQDFLQLNVPPEQFDDPSFEPVLRAFQRRFRDTRTEEGTVMADMLEYVMDDAYTSGRRAILAEFRASAEVLHLFDRGVRDRDALRGSGDVACADDAVVQVSRNAC